jgi:hypothetical protein
MKKIILIINCLSACNFIYAQPSIQWQKCLGGSGLDDANSIQLTSDGGYIVAGESSSNDADVTSHHGTSSTYDYWVVKLNGNGNIIWQKSLGGTTNDYARCVQQTSDSGYIVVGEGYSNDGDVSTHHGNNTKSDYWVVKLDATGTIQWEKSFGGTDNDVATSIQQLTDGSYIIAGYSSSNDGDVSGNHGNKDLWIVKINGSGVLQWQKSLGGTAEDNASCIEQTADGGYIIAGTTYSSDGDVTANHGNSDYWIVKLDALGNIQWQKNYGGNSNDDASSIQQTLDGGYIVAGESASNDGDVTGHHDGININFDYWIVKLDGAGNIQWEKSFGGTDNGSSIIQDIATSAQQTTDGGYIIGGYSSSVDGDVVGNIGMEDYWIIKLNSVGNIEWKKNYGGTDNDDARSIKQTNDGGYIIAGYSSSFDGDVSGNHGGDYWVVKLAPYVGIDEINQKENFISLVPNPTKSIFTILTSLKNARAEISSALGEKIYELQLSSLTTEINLGNHRNGIYFVRILSDEGVITKKVILCK